MSMRLKTLKKKWPKAKIKKEFKENNQRYPDSLKRAVLEAIEGTSQVEVSKVTGIKPGLISNWKCGRFKKTKKKVSKKEKVKSKKQTVKERRAEEKAAEAAATEEAWEKLENSRRDFLKLLLDMEWISERIDEVKLVQYLEETAEKLIFNDQRDLGYAMSVIGEMIKLLKIYLKNPSKKAYETLMKRLI